MSFPLNSLARTRRIRDVIARVLLLIFTIIAVVPLAWILFEVAKRGFGAIQSWSFFTQPPPGFVAARGGGVANGILGTVLMVGIAILISVPLGILGATYLVEFSRMSRLGLTIRFFADVMTGIPSIVFGIFVYTVLVIATGSFSALSGSISLALIMWPVIMRASEEVLRRVPHDVREASFALGVPTWRTVIKVVWPAASSGLVTGAMLGTARAAGETAPLLFTALGNQFISLNVNRPMSALPLEIFRGATTAFAAGNERAWAAALTLIAMILLLNLTARALTGRGPR